MFGVETYLLLPDDQSDGSDLARQGEACQMRLHSSSDASLIEILQRPSCGSGSRGRTLEDIFQIVIMVAVQPTDGLGLFGAFQLATDEAVFPAGVGSECQATVGPQLPLGTETVRSLQDRNEQSGADRADRRNLPQQSRSGMFAAFR